jgi:hypothetical protein
MSHVTRICTRFLDRRALAAAIAELGWTLDLESGQGSAGGEPLSVRRAADGAYEIVGAPVQELRRVYAAIVVCRAAEEAGLRLDAEAPQPDGGRKFVFVPREG